jgi:arylsulfatase A-like enzyme
MKTGSRFPRRTFLRTLAAPLAASLPDGMLQAQPARPNIILILADDLGPGDLGCYGQKVIRTPNLDRMAASGMRFTQAYAGSNVCAPSRCSLMTGLHNGHGRVRDNIPHGVFLQPDDFTIAEVLKQAGYRTCALGKWSLGTPGSWGHPNMQGFDEFFGYLDQDHAHNYYPEFLWDNDREVLQQGNRANKRSSYAPHRIFERATRFVEQNARRPFFLYYAPTLPHWSDYPRDSPMSQDIPTDEPYSNQDWPQVEKNYAAMVTLIDNQVGQLLDQVKRLGIEQQTLILFTSDNGPSAEASHRPAYFNSGAGRRGVKRDLYEGGIRVPLIAQWAGTVKAGAETDEVCAFWDFLPTAAELAGLPLPKQTDGISLLPTLLGKPRKQHEHLYWDYGHGRAKFSQAVRKGTWKAVRNGSKSPVELYNLAEDPAEATNLAAKHPDVLRELTQLIEQAFVPSPDYPILDRKQ